MCGVWLWGVGVCAHEWRSQLSSDEGILFPGARVTGNFEWPNVGARNPTPPHKTIPELLTTESSPVPTILIFSTSLQNMLSCSLQCEYIHWTNYFKVLVHFCLKSTYLDFPGLSGRRHRSLPTPQTRSCSALSRSEWLRAQMAGAWLAPLCQASVTI